jgi:hypothetical protein
MSQDKGKKPGQPEERAPAEAATKRHSRSRRDVLKHLVIGGATVAGATQVLPKKWMKPVVDSVVLPVHAQATGGTITAFWILGDDAPGGPDVGIPVGTTTADTADTVLYDDGTTMTVYGTLSPPAAVVVDLDASVTGTTYTGGFGGTDITANGATGDFSFGDYSPTNGDFGDTPGDGTITLTFSAPGYANSVITLVIN